MRRDRRIGTRLAGYRLDALIGRGGMGVVYRANHLRLDRVVAVKLLNEEYASSAELRRRFDRESKLAARLEHDNIIPIYDAGVVDEVLYIVMPYVAGGDLAARIRRSGPLAPSDALVIVGQVAEALDAAHAAGLVHRDVKPQNILMRGPHRDGRERVYLSDFGIARALNSRTVLTRPTQFVGSFDYAAPELFEPGGSLNPLTDNYALACVLFECLVGRPPFAGENEMAVAMAHRFEPVPSGHGLRPELPTGIDRVLAKGLAKSPDKRYPTAGALLVEAGAVLKSMPPFSPAVVEAVLTKVIARAEPDDPLPTPVTPRSLDLVEPETSVGQNAPLSLDESPPPTGRPSGDRGPTFAGVGRGRMAIYGAVGLGLLVLAGLVYSDIAYMPPPSKPLPTASSTPQGALVDTPSLSQIPPSSSFTAPTGDSSPSTSVSPPTEPLLAALTAQESGWEISLLTGPIPRDTGATFNRVGTLAQHDAPDALAWAGGDRLIIAASNEILLLPFPGGELYRAWALPSSCQLGDPEPRGYKIFFREWCSGESCLECADATTLVSFDTRTLQFTYLGGPDFPDWSSVSPDGTMLGYVENEQLTVMDFQTNTETPLGETKFGVLPSWSPDSSFLFSGERIVSADGHSPPVALDLFKLGVTNPSNPGWGIDADTLLFRAAAVTDCRPDQQPAPLPSGDPPEIDDRVIITGDCYGFYRVSLRSGSISRLATVDEAVEIPVEGTSRAWFQRGIDFDWTTSPDGSLIAFEDYGEIYVLDAGEMPMTRRLATGSLIGWVSPDVLAYFDASETEGDASGELRLISLDEKWRTSIRVADRTHFALVANSLQHATP